MLSVSTKLDDFERFRIRSDLKKYVSFSCGVHPLMIENNENFDEILSISRDKKFVAIGETGLDYHKNLSDRNMILQKSSFLKHIEIAKTLRKPIIVHMRNSFKDVYQIIRDEGIESCGGVIHCFTGDKSQIKLLLDLGLYISFSGIVTFQNSHHVKESVKFIPMDRLMIETDSPYLSPYPLRGKINKPSNLKYIAHCISDIRNIDISIFAEQTTKNFFNLFKNINSNQTLR
ncbi:hypothetical protein AOE55_01765 [Candidatus Riesia pediculicola]|nr:hypothetical protein AOE55_01765 [Candidatus Riesia pediculicola]